MLIDQIELFTKKHNTLPNHPSQLDLTEEMGSLGLLPKKNRFDLYR